MSKHFVIIGSTLSGNKGAAAMLESAVQTLTERFPGSTFTLLTYLPTQREEERNPYKNLQILKASPLYLGLVINLLALLYFLLPFLRTTIRRNQQIDALVRADVLLDQGGITFVDGREKFLLYNIASILPALFVGTKVVKCAQALGPFNNPLNRWAAKLFLPKMTAIVARGSITHQYLTELGLENTIQAADYAFLLELQEQEQKSAQRYYDPQFFTDTKVVGISPSVVMKKKVDASGKDYIKILADFCNALIQEGYKVVIIPHSVRLQTEKTHNNDLPLCRTLFERITEKEKSLLLDDELTSQELRAVIGWCDYFVASRFHAMVSALAMKVPTLVIGWNHKYEEVLHMFELEEWAFGHRELTSTHLKKEFHRLVGRSVEVRTLLDRHLPAVKKQAYKQVDIIAKNV